MNLSFGQRIKRRIWLTFAHHYYHPDGTLELDFDEKMGVDPTRDSPEMQEKLFDAWSKREARKSHWWSGFAVGTVFGITLFKLWPW